MPLVLRLQPATPCKSALVNRVGQCDADLPDDRLLQRPWPGDPDKNPDVGGNLRFFGDGWQFSKQLDGRRSGGCPSMDGEFLCEDVFGTSQGRGRRQLPDPGRDAGGGPGGGRGGGGGNARAVPGCHHAVPRRRRPVGQQGRQPVQKAPGASTNDAYCPTLRGAVKSALPDGATAVYEIVIDGLDRRPSRTPRESASGRVRPGVLRISAGNYGGNLGPHHIHLKELIKAESVA